ncbi:MAG: polysaccharide pyruvyl transferase family protein [Hydrogenophilaceae bacterium]|nr:polysaccharide pyruvyl transferase family protein [Hydrogenophilaceae bacterium]
MKILTWDTTNYGDRLNDIVWPHYLPGLLDDNQSELLVGIGSLLNHRLPQGPAKHIFGAGYGHGDVPEVDSTWNVVWVRGPLTAKTLNLSPDKAITDGGMLLADMYERAAKEHDVSFIPHCSAEGGALDELERICARAGINFINPNWPLDRVLRQINASRKLITEALHGAITADALRVPWLPVARSGVYSFKWHDWLASMGMEYRPVGLPYRPSWISPELVPTKLQHHLIPLLRPFSKAMLEKRLAALAKSDQWRLSDDKVLKQRLAEMKGAMRDFG